jgi:site-specific DNA recombinase
MRAALYCRVSTVEQVQNLSLSTQEKACRAYAEREGYDIGEVFVDRGESAKTTARPEFRRLLAYCRQHAGKVQAVIVYGLSRFSRNSTDHHAIAALLRGYGVALRSVTEPIDDSPAGRFMEGICAAMAQFDNDLKSDRTKVGMRAALERGRWVWQAPIGYRNGARAIGEPSLVATERGPDITAAFADVAAGRAPAEVFARLRAMGIRGPRTLLTMQTFHRLMRNPVYCGRIQSPGFGVDRAGDWVPLVDDATWRLAQARLASDTAPPIRARERPDFPLRRFIRCGTCDRPLTGGWSKGKMGRKYAYYHCRRNCVSTPTGALEAAFVAYLELLRPIPEFLAVLRMDVLLAYRTEVDQAAAERAKLEARATHLRGQLRRLDDAFLFEKVIDQATYIERRDEMRAQLGETELALASAVTETIDAEGVLAGAEYAVEHAAALWRSAASGPQRVRLQWALFPDGLVWNGSEVLNPSRRFGIYEIGPIGGGGTHVAFPMRVMLNSLGAWPAVWRAYLDAA